MTPPPTLVAISAGLAGNYFGHFGGSIGDDDAFSVVFHPASEAVG